MLLNKTSKIKVLAYIPARGGSKRIVGKNIRNFAGKPLIAHTIEQALSCKIADRVIVDTDSLAIAKVAKKYGAEVPFLRPADLAKDTSKVVESVIYLLEKLKKDENYIPSHILLLQTTSPLREIKDIQKCWQEMKKYSKATTVLTVCPTHPKLYHLDHKNYTNLVNGSEDKTNNTQAWPPAYILNGCFIYIVKTYALLKEKRIITTKTKAVICPKWRSVDLDTPEEWVMAELLFKHKKYINEQLKKF